MVAITVLNQAKVPIGPFTREEVAAKLISGELSLDDLAHVEGLTQWTPLRDVLAKVDGAVPPPVSAMPPVALAAGGPQAYSYSATMQPPGGLVYAGFWLRFVANLIDLLIVGIPIIVIIVINNVTGAWAFEWSQSIVKSSEHTDSSLAVGGATGVGMIFVGVVMIALQLVFWAVEILILWLYFAKLESGPRQSTFGKRILRLKVTNLAGGRISFGQATGRFFGKIVSCMTMYIGYIMAGFTERKQALHDMLASTLVIKS